MKEVYNPFIMVETGDQIKPSLDQQYGIHGLDAIAGRSQLQAERLIILIKKGYRTLEQVKKLTIKETKSILENVNKENGNEETVNNDTARRIRNILKGLIITNEARKQFGCF